jgi:tetratricopeptide (TPR) repeat protein
MNFAQITLLTIATTLSLPIMTQSVQAQTPISLSPSNSSKPTISDYDQLIQRHPNHAIAYQQRSNARAKAGDLAGAKRDQEMASQITAKLLSSNPTTAQSWFERATMIYRDSAQDITADLSQAIRLQPSYAEAYLKRAELIWLPGVLEQTSDNKTKIQAAIADYSQFIQLQPKQSAIAYQQRAQLQAKLGNIKVAIADYDQLLGIQSNQPQLYQERANLREQNRDNAGAIADLTAAIKLNPQNSALYIQRGRLYSQQQQSKLAIADFTTALQSNKESSGREKLSAWYQVRGYEQFKLGENEAAVGDFTGAISHNPENAQAYLLRSDALAKMKIRDRAIADLKKAADLFKQRQENSYGWHKDFFQAAYQRQVNDLSQNLATPALKTAEDYFKQGCRMVDRGDFAGALSALTQAIQLNPKLADPYVYRAAAKMLSEFDYDSLQVGSYSPGSIVDLTQAIQLQPKRVDLYTLRATIYEVNSDYPKALADVNRAIELSPNDVNLYLQRQKINTVLGDMKAEAADVAQIRRIEASRK